jgi:hypothetical protein
VPMPTPWRHRACDDFAKHSATGTRTRVARVRAEYPNQLDYSGVAGCRLSVLEVCVVWWCCSLPAWSNGQGAPIQLSDGCPWFGDPNIQGDAGSTPVAGIQLRWWWCNCRCVFLTHVCARLCAHTHTHAHPHTHTHTHTHTRADTPCGTRARDKNAKEQRNMDIPRRLCFNLRLQHLKILLLHR